MNLPYQYFKVPNFPPFGEEWERKAARLSGKVFLWFLHLIWTHVWLIPLARRVLHLKEMIYSPKSSLLFDPRGSWSRSGGDARLPMCVFAILPLPFLLFLLFCLGRPFCNLRLSQGPPSAENRTGLYKMRLWRHISRGRSNEAKWFLFLRAITFSGAPFHGLGGDDFARPGTEVFIALL